MQCIFKRLYAIDALLISESLENSEDLTEFPISICTNYLKSKLFHKIKGEVRF